MLKLARYLVLIGALCIATISLVGGGLGLVASGLDRSSGSLPLATASLSVLVVGSGLGLGLAVQSWASINKQPSAPCRPSGVWPATLLFFLSAVVGHWIHSFHPRAVYALPPIHVLATGLPPLIVLAAVGRRLQGSTRWREVVLQLGSGAFASTTMAFALEFVLILILLVIGLLVLTLLPEGKELVQTLIEQLRYPNQLQNPARVVSLAGSPIVIAAALAVVSGLIPVVEESVKTIGIGLLAWRRPDQAQAFIWGVAGGAGFALVEGTLNTATVLDLWLPVVLLRVGGTVLHCATGGLMGLAWHAVLSKRRWKRGFGLFAASVAVHGLWNALTVALVVVPLNVGRGGPGESSDVRAGLATLAIVGLLALLTLLMSLGLARLTRAVQGHSTRPQAGVGPAGPPARRPGGSPGLEVADGGALPKDDNPEELEWDDSPVSE